MICGPRRGTSRPGACTLGGKVGVIVEVVILRRMVRGIGGVVRRGIVSFVRLFERRVSVSHGDLSVIYIE